MRKLSRSWHGPYRVTALREPDISVTKVYQPQSSGINIYQSRVKLCPLNFPAGFYWYGGNSKGPGRLPKWVEQLLEENSTQCTVTNQNGTRCITDTYESSDLTNSEDEEQSDDEES